MVAFQIRSVGGAVEYFANCIVMVLLLNRVEAVIATHVGNCFGIGHLQLIEYDVVGHPPEVHALPVIDLEGIAPLVNEKHEELMNANWDKLQALDLASDHLARGARSVMKLAAASARINQRAKANEDDVRAAFELYSEKVRFISLCEPALRPVNSWVGSRGAKERRQSAIADHFGGFGPVHIREVMAMFPEVKSKKTIERDLRAVGAEPDGRGYWLVPVARPGGSDVGAASAPQSLSSRPSERRRKGDLVPKQARRLLSI